MIDAQVLDEKRKLLEDQKMQHFALFNQAQGAIALCDNLKELLTAKDHLTTEEFGNLVGGKVEAITPIKDHA